METKEEVKKEEDGRESFLSIKGGENIEFCPELYKSVIQRGIN